MDPLNFHWEANTIRLILFPTLPASTSLDWWRLIAQSDPDSEESRPREGIRRALGRFKNQWLEVVVTPIRVDIVYTAGQQIEPNGAIRPNHANFTEALDDLLGPFLKALSAADIDLSRVALAGGALTPTNSVDESYEKLARLCRSATVEPGMRDFLFRVNWKQKTDIADVVEFNRLTAFSALSISAGYAVNPAAPLVRGEASHYALMDIDINTPVERTSPLPRSSLALIYSEMRALMLENLEFGEVNG